MLKIFNDLLTAADDDKVSLFALLDLSAAFDTIDQTILLDRLCHTYGIPGIVLKWFDSYLSDRNQCVVVSGKVKDYVINNCNCPVPCNFLIYDPTISFASTSVYATDQLLASTTTKDIQRRFLYARETTERMNHLKFNHFLALEEKMRTSFERLKKVMTHDVKERIQAQRKSLQDIYQHLKDVKDQKRHLLEWQAYHVTKNFMRARNAMEERTMMYLMMGFQEYSYQVEARIFQMATNGSNGLDPDVRASIYYDLMNLINGRVDLADRAFANYTQLYGAYYNGTPIFRYKFKEELREDNPYITPRPLLRDCLFRTAYTRKFSSRVGKDIMEIKKFLLQYSALANTSYINGTVDREEVHQ
ncbi:amiloride-sensitive cation channel 4-B [Elysia marginata]|uniref:Amiloride-sensitive cation channel 4-B n=1 Tax=Elysia marginata TaxID=1093978 RepID=A0AAV4K0G0_9GAST|nr:amiloride-sensitive cation channel 4-B [Elysia marginata]